MCAAPVRTHHLRSISRLDGARFRHSHSLWRLVHPPYSVLCGATSQVRARQVIRWTRCVSNSVLLAFSWSSSEIVRLYDRTARQRVIVVSACNILTMRAVGGPDRPIPQPKPQAAASAASKASALGSPGGRGSPASSTMSRDLANSASSGTNSLYDRLNNALAERGFVWLSSRAIAGLTRTTARCSMVCKNRSSLWNPGARICYHR